MLWFFERDNARLHYEIRRQSDGPDFELVITGQGGRQRVEQFPRGRRRRSAVARAGGEASRRRLADTTDGAGAAQEATTGCRPTRAALVTARSTGATCALNPPGRPTLRTTPAPSARFR